MISLVLNISFNNNKLLEEISFDVHRALLGAHGCVHEKYSMQ